MTLAFAIKFVVHQFQFSLTSLKDSNDLGIMSSFKFWLSPKGLVARYGRSFM